MNALDHGPGRLEEVCLRQGLVRLETRQAWRALHPDASFVEQLLRHTEEVSREHWIEMLADRPKGPPYFPTPRCRGASGARTSQGLHLSAEYRALLLEDPPLRVIAVVDPFDTTDLERWVGDHLSDFPWMLVATSPHDFAEFSRSQSCGTESDCPASSAQVAEWAAWLGFESDAFCNEQEIRESLWRREVPVPVTRARHLSTVTPIGGEAEALLVESSPTHAWVVTPRPTDPALEQRLYQKLGRCVHPLAIAPGDWELLQRKSSALVSENSHSNAPSSLLVRRWPGVQGADPQEKVLWEAIVTAGITLGASDIHLEPKIAHIQVRFRIDGTLIVQSPLPRAPYPMLLRRAKIMSGMRQDQIGVIQDGSTFQMVAGRRYDLRTSITVLHGGDEALVIRIFSAHIPSLDELRLAPRERSLLQWCLDQEHGLLLISGPTGSGKTTTLYSCLQAVSQPGVSTVTIEQPVEKHLGAAKQISVADETCPGALTYPAALRSVLRQDPDIILIGEIRDPESASIAVSAALTGHLVLSTVHANDAVGVLERLCWSFAVDRHALSYALKLSIAQRLVRRLCPNCRRPRRSNPPPDLRPFINPQTLQTAAAILEPVGCESCRGTGFAGRLILMEMLPVDPDLLSLLEQRASPRQIRDHNRRRGFPTLLDRATDLLLQGEICLEDASTFAPWPLSL